MRAILFVYIATPLRPLQLGHRRPPAFALYSADMRIRYRAYGEEAGADDDAIDTRAPESAASARAAEASASRDLREVANAEDVPEASPDVTQASPSAFDVRDQKTPSALQRVVSRNFREVEPAQPAFQAR